MKENHFYRAEGRRLTKGKILNIFLVSLVFTLIVSLISSLGSSFGPTFDWDLLMITSPGNPFLNMVFNILAFLVSGYFAYGMVKVFIAVSQDYKPEIDKAILASVTEQPIKAPLLALVEGFFLSLWTLLFIIPGIVKSYSYAMSTFILAQEPDIDVVASISKSRQLMNGKKMQLFILDLSYFGWYILSLFTLGILTIWVASWHQTARVLFFQDAYQKA
jgi:uncharacterized membrane protein